METYFIAIDLSVNDNANQCAAQILCQFGPKVRRMFEANTAVIPKAVGESQYQYVVRVICEKELPKKNNTYESYIFRKIIQREGESFQSFIQRLECQVNRCEFTDRDRQLKDQVVLGCLSENLRKVALREDPNLQRLCELGKTEEFAVSRSHNIASNENSDQSAFKTFRRGNSQSSRPQRNDQVKRCHWCGSTDIHGKTNCPARDKQCNSCNEYGHFARVCRSGNPRRPGQRVNRADNVEDQSRHEEQQVTDEFANAVVSDEYVFNVQESDRRLKSPCNILVDTNVPVNFIPDTGASVNIVDFETYTKLKQYKHYPLLRTNTRIFAYGSSDPLPLKGMV